MPKRKHKGRFPLEDLAQPLHFATVGSRARQPGSGGETGTRQPELESDLRTEGMRTVTLALSRNLNQVHWAWEHPVKAYDHVSVPMQQVMTFLALVALFPLEEMVTDLAGDELALRKVPEWVAPDLDPANPEGFLMNLPHWRLAVAFGQVEVTLDRRGCHVTGLRAWQQPGGGSLAWAMDLQGERLSALVECLMKFLPGWGLPPFPFKLPPPRPAY